jgi:hypothetical protein
MRVRTTLAAACAALAMASGAAASAAPAPPAPEPALPALTLLPQRVGASVSFHYDANATAPAANGPAHAVVTLTRVVNDRVAITVTPDDGAPSAVLGRIENGTFRIDAAAARSGRADVARADGAGVPSDGPIGGLPGGTNGGAGPRGDGGYGQRGQGGYGQGPSGQGPSGQGGYGQGGYGQGGGYASRAEARPTVPGAIAVVAALVAGRAGAGASRSWAFTAAAGAGGGVPMTARVESVRGGVASISAEGSGEAQVPSEQPLTVAAPPQGGEGGYGGRRGGGGYGGGRGGYGGQPGGYGGQGAAQPRATVTATVAYHVESAFRGGRLELARGSETITPHATGAPASTVRWTLTPL